MAIECIHIDTWRSFCFWDYIPCRASEMVALHIGRSSNRLRYESTKSHREGLTIIHLYLEDERWNNAKAWSIQCPDFHEHSVKFIQVACGGVHEGLGFFRHFILAKPGASSTRLISRAAPQNIASPGHLSSDLLTIYCHIPGSTQPFRNPPRWRLLSTNTGLDLWINSHITQSSQSASGLS